MRRSWAIHDKCEGNEGEGEVFRRESENIDCNVRVRIVLRECVGASEDERLEEDVATEKGSASELFDN